MKFFLAENRPIKINENFSHGLAGKFGKSRLYYTAGNNDYSKKEKQLAEVVPTLLELHQHRLNLPNEEAVVSIVGYKCPHESTRKEKLQLLDKTMFLRRLNKIVAFGGQSMSVKVTLMETEPGKSYAKQQDGAEIVTEDMTIVGETAKTCEGNLILLNERAGSWMSNFFKTGGLVNCLFTIEVTVSPGQLPKPTPFNLKTVVYEKMLLDDIYSDAIIIPNNGNPLKCHKAMLSACSTVLETMFKTGLKESTTGQVEMPDMTEVGVRAFLAFIYYQDPSVPEENCEIAFELLNAAHKYNVIGNMEEAMVNIFLAKPVKWFDLEVTLKLFQFARMLPSGEQLKIKAVKVLAQSFAKLQDSETYTEMFQKNAAAAMELCQLFASQSIK